MPPLTCPDCGATQIAVAGAPPARRLSCYRCGAVLVRRGGIGPGAVLALAAAAVPLFAAAVTLPLLRLHGAAGPSDVSVVGAAAALHRQGVTVLAALVFATSVVIPAVRLAALLQAAAQAQAGGVAPARPWLLHRVAQALRPWAQLEILLLGLLIAFGKLSKPFDVMPGPGVWFLVAFLLVDAAVTRALDRRPPQQTTPPPGPAALTRAAALLLASAALVIPANLLPVMTTATLAGSQTDTIASGVVALWRGGAWGLAAVILVASIVVPALKIAALALLVTTAWLGSRWQRAGRTRLYRVIEAVGRWSMLDVFVMAVLAALLRRRVASVEIAPGAIAYTAVVVLTMLSSMSFHPRLIWSTGGRS